MKSVIKILIAGILVILIYYAYIVYKMNQTMHAIEDNLIHSEQTLDKMEKVLTK